MSKLKPKKGKKVAGSKTDENTSNRPQAIKKKKKTKFKRNLKPNHDFNKVDLKQTNKEKKQDNPETVRLNKKMIELSSQKKLNDCKAIFEDLVGSGTANSFSYVTMMNAYVNCGNTHKAVDCFKKMRSENFKPDVVAYTTIVKGLCSLGRVDETLEMINEMEKEKVMPNIRTANTLLRGCIFAGRVQIGETILRRMQKVWGVQPDSSTWEYVISLMCRNLDLSKALPMLGRGKMMCGVEISENASIHVSLARAAAFLLDHEKLSKKILLASKILDIKENQFSKDLISQNESLAQKFEPSCEPNQVALGGKRGWGTKNVCKARQNSLQVFVDHRHSELRKELSLINEYSIIRNKNRDCGSVYVDGILSQYKQVFLVTSIPMTVDQEINTNAFGKQLTTYLLESFGLSAILKQMVTLSCQEDNTLSFEKAVDNFSNALGKAFTEQGKLKLGEIFERTAKAETAILPTKLEICSGAGEWVVDQASNEYHESNWIALEIRHDRAHQIFTRAIFKGVRNLCIIVGDASKVVPFHLPKKSISCIFINFPEPPQQTGGEETEANHLLKKDFFNDMRHILIPKGKITVVTDNRWYAHLVLKIASSLTGFKGVELPLKVAKMLGTLSLYQGYPTAECGAMSESSGNSYFDRLAKRDKGRANHQVFTLCLSRKKKSKES